MISEEKIRGALHGAADTRIIVLDEVGSTNNFAKENAVPGGTLICAARQTGGRGRRGKSFFSPEGGVYMTAVFDADKIPSPPLLTVICAAAEAKFFEEAGVGGIGIKWVNDIFCDGKKVSGILCEAICGADGAISRVICGIGINVNMPREAFAPEIRELAGSVRTDRTREEIIGGIYSGICALLCVPREEVLAEYKKRLFLLGDEVSYVKDGKRRSGTAFDINSDANLLVRTRDGTDTLTAGEISLGSGGFCGVEKGR